MTSFSRRRSQRNVYIFTGVSLWSLLLFYLFPHFEQQAYVSVLPIDEKPHDSQPHDGPPKHVFVNYAYCHTSKDRLENLQFFLRHGVTNPHPSTGLVVHYGLVVNGACHDESCREGVKSMNGDNVSLRVLSRENIGFDFGQHTAMLEDLDRSRLTYDYYIFMNAGVTGPFIPAYMPPRWHWVQAFIDKLINNVGVVGTCIVCLPESDLGGYGPKVEAFAFGMTRNSLRVVRSHGTSFRQHKGKVAAIVDGEYALSKTIFKYNMTIDSLQLAYKNVHWHPEMSCNGLHHATRHGTYFGGQVHPLETLFHKNKWEHSKKPVQPVEEFERLKEFIDGKHLPFM